MASWIGLGRMKTGDSAAERQDVQAGQHILLQDGCSASCGFWDFEGENFTNPPWLGHLREWPFIVVVLCLGTGGPFFRSIETHGFLESQSWK